MANGVAKPHTPINESHDRNRKSRTSSRKHNNVRDTDGWPGDKKKGKVSNGDPFDYIASARILYVTIWLSTLSLHLCHKKLSAAWSRRRRQCHKSRGVSQQEEYEAIWKSYFYYYYFRITKKPLFGVCLTFFFASVIHLLCLCLPYHCRSFIVSDGVPRCHSCR